MKLTNKKIKTSKKKPIIMFLLFVVSLLMVVAYAFYSQSLFIDTTGGIIEDWNLEFTNVEEGTASVGASYEVAVTNALIGTRTKTNDLIATLEVSLSHPNDYISFNIDITNFSTRWNAEYIMHMIDYAEADNFIEWTISDFQEGEVIAYNNILGNDPISTRTITLTATWKDSKRGQLPAGYTNDYSTTYKESATITMHFEPTTKEGTTPSIVPAPSPILSYSTESWTNGDVTVTLDFEDDSIGYIDSDNKLLPISNNYFNKPKVAFLGSGDYTLSSDISILNNNGSNQYTFNKNGSFTFEYRYDKVKRATITATVNWIDKVIPVITSAGNPKENTWTNQDVTINPTVSSTSSGHAKFLWNVDGGAWQEDFPFTFTEEIVATIGLIAVNNAGSQSIPAYTQLKINKTEPIIVLNGLSDMTLEVYSIYTEPGATATDQHGADISSQIVISGSVNTSIVGDYQVYYDVIDASGNTKTLTRTIHIVDTTKPVLTITPLNLYVNQYDTFDLMSGVSAIDNYDGDITSKVTITPPSSNWNVVTAATIRREFTYSITDINGNTSTAVRTITMVDKEAPVISISSANIYVMEVNTPSDANAKPIFTATATDNVDASVSVVITDDININVVGTYTVTFTATDAARNTTVQTRSFTVRDTKAPVISLVGLTNITLEVHSVYTEAGYSAFDHYDGDVTGDVVVTTNMNTSVVGTYWVRYNVKDSAGNTATQQSRTISIVDTTLPVITIAYPPGKSYVVVEQGASYNLMDNVTAEDNYDGNITSKIIRSHNTIDTTHLGMYYVTYDVTDDHGNKALQQTKAIKVSTKPVITVTGATSMEVNTPLDAHTLPTISATAVDSLGASVPVDITGVNLIDINVVGTYPIIYTATDVDGKVQTLTQNFQVRHTQVPTFTFLGEQYMEIGLGDGYIEDGWIINDYYHSDSEVTIVIKVTDSDANQIASTTTTGDIIPTLPAWDPIPEPYKSTAGVYFLHYTITDALGNTQTKTREVVVYNNILPSITLLLTNVYTMEVDTPTDHHSIPSLGATANDRYGVPVSPANVVVTNNININLPGNYTVWFTATDTYGNTRVQAMPFTVTHNRGPVITLNGSTPMTIYSSSTYGGSSTYVEPGASAFDDYDGAGVSVLITGNINTNIPGSYTMTYTATDSANNTTTRSRTVIVEDNAPPVISFATDPLIINQNAPCDVMSGVSASDNIDGDITGKVMASPISINTSWPGYFPVTYTVRDSSNNLTTETRDVRVVDVTPPVITIDATNVYSMEVDTTLDAHTIPVFKATANDNVDGSVSVSITHDIDKEEVGTYTVTFTATDAHGNVQTETRTFTVKDTTPPILTVSPTTMNLDQYDTFNLMSGVSAVDYYDGDVTSSISVSPPSSDWSEVSASTITRVFTYSVTDANGNTKTATRTVTMLDKEEPDITIDPTNDYVMEVNTILDSQTKPIFKATATDNVDASVSVVITDDININVVGTYTITFTATDIAGNIASSTKSFTVEDTTAPVITVDDLEETIEVFSSFNAMDGVSAYDYYDGDITGNININGAVNTNVVGTYYLDYDVSDSSGNNAIQVTKTVHVFHTTPPVITVSPSTVYVDQFDSYVLTTGVSAVSNYDGDITSSISISPTSINFNVVATHLVTYSVTDSNGNSASQTRTIIINDKEAPVITIDPTNDYAMEVNTTLDAHSKPIFKATATDNVDVSVSVVITDDININVVGTYTITFTATDTAGNIASSTKSFLVEDTTPPLITVNDLEETIEVLTSFNATYGVSAYDYYDGDVTSSIKVTGSVNPSVVGDYYLDYDVKDNAGNSAIQVTKTVHVVNTIPPVLTINVPVMNLDQYDTFNLMSGVSAVDSYGTDITANIIVSPSSSNWNIVTASTITRVFNYSVTDKDGNTSTKTRTITMLDKEAPVITIDSTNVYTMEANTTLDAHSKPTFKATATDNVDSSVSVVISDNININVVGSYTVTFTATDTAGNISTTSKAFLVEDTTPPVITLNNNSTITIEVYSVYNDFGASAYDYYDGNITGSIIVSGSVNPSLLGTYYIYYNVKDANNNAASTVTRTVHVVDTTPPVITPDVTNVYTMQVNTVGNPQTKPLFKATAVDNVDGSVSVIITDDIDINVVGTYTVTFTATDNAGNKAIVTKVFTVSS